MRTIAIVAAFFAGLIHVTFFFAEAIAWNRPAVWRAFGATSTDDARSKAATMFNLGFYNLFLGIGAIGGSLLVAATGVENADVLLYSCAFMVGASVVLVAKTPALWRGATVQAAAPLVAIIALLAS